MSTATAETTPETEPITTPAVPGPLTIEQVDAAVESFKAQVIEWETGPLVDRRRGTLCIDRQLVDKARAFFDFCETAGERGAAWEKAEQLMLAEDFRKRFVLWIEKRDARYLDQFPQGDPGLWMAWNEVLRHNKWRVPQEPPAPIWKQLSAYRGDGNTMGFYETEELARHHVGVRGFFRSPREVARQMGWRNSYGEPDHLKVLEEWDQPGRHYNPETWLDASFEKHKADLESRFLLHRQCLVMRKGQPTLPPFGYVASASNSTPASFLR